MGLSKQEEQETLKSFVKTTGCPLGLKGELQAFAEGANSMLRYMSPNVTKDVDNASTGEEKDDV